MSYKRSLSILTEADRERLLCAFLNSQVKSSQIDFDAAAKDFGSVNTLSFLVMYNSARKKLNDAKEYEELGIADAMTPQPEKKRRKLLDELELTKEVNEVDKEKKSTPKKPPKQSNMEKRTRAESSESVEFEFDEALE